MHTSNETGPVPAGGDALDRAALTLQRVIEDVLQGVGSRANPAVRWLRGEPLGHPAHPALVDGAGGYWMASYTLDLLAAIGFKSFGRASDAMLAFGLLSAAPAVAAGAIEFSEQPEGTRREAVIHAAMAASGTMLYLISFVLRLTGRRHKAFFASTLASGLAVGAAWKGGELVFRHGAGQRPRRRPYSSPN